MTTQERIEQRIRLISDKSKIEFAEAIIRKVETEPNDYTLGQDTRYFSRTILNTKESEILDFVEKAKEKVIKKVEALDISVISDRLELLVSYSEHIARNLDKTMEEVFGGQNKKDNKAK